MVSKVTSLDRYRRQKIACKEAARAMRDRAMSMNQTWGIVRQQLEEAKRLKSLDN